MSFADEIYQFALSTTALSRESFIRLLSTLNRYATETLAIEHARLLVPHPVTGHAGLNRLNLGTFKPESSHRIKTGRGSYYGHVAYAFDNGTPLWVVSSKPGEPLIEARRYVDGWSGIKKLPRYQPMSDLDSGGQILARAAIVVPVRRDDRTVGVLNLETSEYVESTENSRREFSRIADALAILLRLMAVDSEANSQTEEAIQTLEVKLRVQPKITRPGVFVAYSERADPTVVDSISRVLAHFAAVMEPVLWQHMHEPGNIIAQLLETMSKCDYGVCYLSEPRSGEPVGTEPTTAAFIDNPNVLFEAGMFKGRTHANGRSVWIPIREASSTELPFDLRQERILEVARARAGTLSVRSFESSLRTALGAMIKR